MTRNLGVQAINIVAPDLSPKPGKQKSTGRDYEYKRLGTVSILAALDLHTGKIIAQVHDRHRSREFMELLAEEKIITLYKNHALSEQFHIEFKTDLDLERLPSDKFATNAKVMALRVFTYSITSFALSDSLDCLAKSFRYGTPVKDDD